MFEAGLEGPELVARGETTMNTYPKSIACAGVLAVCACLLVGTADGKSLEVPFSIDTTVELDLSQATIWVDDQGIQHVRGAMYYETIVGEAGGVPIGGMNIGEMNWNIDTVTGDGDAHAFSTFEGTWGNLVGTFSGVGDFDINAGIYDATFTWHGGGDFASMRVIGSATGVFGAPQNHSDGIVHLPHGEGGLPSGSPLNLDASATWGKIKAAYE
jgi:hypothetical protein